MVSFKNRLTIQNFICFSYKKNQMFAVQNFVYIYLFHLKKNVFSSKLCLLFICFTYKKTQMFTVQNFVYFYLFCLQKTPQMYELFLSLRH
jgi:hypothetical protein